MRVVQVCHRYYPYVGGVETHVRAISERLAKSFDVQVLTTDPSGRLVKEETIGGVRVRRFRSWAPNDLYYFSRELERYLRQHVRASDILHAHSYHDLPALYCTRVENVNRFIFTPHYHGKGRTLLSNILHFPYKLLAKKTFLKADRIICVSNYEKKLVLDSFRISKEKISVIPNGIDLEEFAGLKKRSKDHRVVLHVGRLEKYKGIDYIIRSLPRLDENVRLEVVGEGPYRRNLVNLTKQLHVENRVRFIQNVPRKELLRRYASSDVFVSLSKHEAYGISVAEALAARTPCVVANVSALKEWIDGENCFGVEYPPDVDKLAWLIEAVIGKEANAPELKSWDEVTEMTMRVYEDR